MSRKAGSDPLVGDRPSQQLGALLSGLRAQAGLKRRDIAEVLGIDPSNITRYERGQRPVPARVLRYYAERFDAPDLVAELADLVREAEWDRQRRRDPVLIARQNRYPLPGDAAEFVSEEPPDGITIPIGSTITRVWTIRNSGTVPWRDRRLRRIGPTTGPWTLTSERFTPIPDTAAGQEATIPVILRAPDMETASVAQFKMVDKDELLYFPTTYATGLAIYVLVGHEASPHLTTHKPGDMVG
jgi:transcriptional regulator with XRE-family HTH domain